MLKRKIFQSPRWRVWLGNPCVGAGLNPIMQPHMFWLLKVLILHSDKLNCIEWCVLGQKSLSPLLHVLYALFPQPKAEVVISYPIIKPIYRCWLSPSTFKCQSNNCSLCLCVRLCWGRGTLWGTLDSQVTWLDNDFVLLLSVTNFVPVNFCLCSPQHPCLQTLCTKHPSCPWLKAPWITQGSNHALTNPPLTNTH